MAVFRKLRRCIRTWKFLWYIVGFFVLVQILASLHTDPNSLEREELKRFRFELNKNHEAANAMLQNENPHRRKYDKDFLPNPKDPQFRNQFLDKIGNVGGFGVIEEGLDNSRLIDIHKPGQILTKKEQNIDENFKFQAICEVTLKDAQSAINRAKSARCKQEIADIACKMQENDLFPEAMPRKCPHESKFIAQAPMPATFEDGRPSLRICFILVVHGRSFRQFRRLLRVIYHVNHYYYIHVDKRSDYLLREILKETERYPNVRVAPWRMATIWGGASLLQMLLRAMKDVLTLWHDWDFFINLSGLDFPIENDEKLIKFLSTYRDKNFMKSHGREDDKFIRKQGLDRVFVECDQHMWRLGKRNLPKGIQVNGGSDWLALNREFCDFIVFGKDKLLNDLKLWYKYSLLPAESFFHTLIQNSEHCEHYVDNNLRVTNWNRARGCKCQYKHIVDWCGCSPNDFYPSDLARLHTTRPVFFARKFEEIINQEVVNYLDFKLYGEYPSYVPALNSYWENCYDHLDGTSSVSDSSISHYYSFARLGFADLTNQFDFQANDSDCSLRVGKVHQVEVYKKSEEFFGYVVVADGWWGKQKMESNKPEPHFALQVLVSRQPVFRIVDSSSPLASRIESASIGTQWDVKELVLRDWGGIIGPLSDVRLVARWRKGSEDFVVTIVVIDPFNVVAEYSDFRTPSKSAGVTDTSLGLRKPLRPGKWTIRFYTQRQFNKISGELDFFVGPLQFMEGEEGQPQISDHNRGVKDDAQLNSGNKNLYSVRTTLGLQKNDDAWNRAQLQALNVGNRVQLDWIDSIIGEGWHAKDICFISKNSHEWKESQPEKCRTRKQIIPNLCANMNWSSFSPDPKSELGPVKANGRIR